MTTTKGSGSANGTLHINKTTSNGPTTTSGSISPLRPVTPSRSISPLRPVTPSRSITSPAAEKVLKDWKSTPTSQFNLPVNVEFRELQDGKKGIKLVLTPQPKKQRSFSCFLTRTPKKIAQLPEEVTLIISRTWIKSYDQDRYFKVNRSNNKVQPGFMVPIESGMHQLIFACWKDAISAYNEIHKKTW